MSVEGATLGDDVEEQAVNAVVAVLDTDAGVQSVTGRDNGNAMGWSDTSRSTLPAISVFIRGMSPTGGVGENWLVEVVVACFADSEGTARALRQAARLALTTLQLADVGRLDSVVMPGSDRPLPTRWEGDTDNQTARADYLCTLWLTLQPTT
jgi:hypothetical protein